MLSAWEVRGLLDRKYAIQEQEANIKQQEAASAGLLRGAQARGLDVTSGLAPGLAAAQIGESGARTRGLDVETGLAPGIAASNILRNSVLNRDTEAGIKLTNANVGRVGAETTAVRQLSAANRDVFGIGMPKIPQPVVPSVEVPTITPRKRPTLLQPSFRGGFGFP